MAIPKCNFHCFCNALIRTAIFAAISKMSVPFKNVLTKNEKQVDFLKQNATLRPTNFTNVWLKCAKIIALAVGKQQCHFYSHFVDDWFFWEMVTRELQKTADVTPTSMQKRRRRCVNIQKVIKRQCLPTVFIGLRNRHYALFWICAAAVMQTTKHYGKFLSDFKRVSLYTVLTAVWDLTSKLQF